MSTEPAVQSSNTGGGASVGRDLYIARGDFIGRDQHRNYYIQQVTPVFTPRPATRAGERQPYFSGQPFRIGDQDLFTGREVQIGQVQRQVNDPATLATVVYGPADVGKTSFLSAGVLPHLNSLRTNVFPLRDYGDGASLLQALLLGRAAELELGVATTSPVGEVARAISAAPGQRLVLVLDQFERFFLPQVSQEDRDRLRDALDAMVEAADPHRFQILFAIRDDWQSALDRALGDRLPGLRASPVHLLAFGRDQAGAAILHPTRELGIQPVFDEDFVAHPLLDDLAGLSGEKDGSILPADLQIVCQYLYEAARAAGAQSIKADLYYRLTGDKGAVWVLDRHFQGLLARVEGAQRERATELATALLARGPQAWATAPELPVEGVAAPEVEGTLAEMARAELLVWHLAGEQRAYAFASHSVARAAERALGREAQKWLRARRELDYVWRDWVADEAWARRYQLHLLEDYARDQPLPPEQALVALRSAVTRGLPARPWLEHLQAPGTSGLIRELETGTNPAAEGLTRRAQARRVFAQGGEALAARPASQTFGEVGWLAAAHPQWQGRETAAVALAAAYGLETLARVDEAVKASGGGRWRRAELRGMLADADEEIAASIGQKGRGERLATWWWRFRRRVVRDGTYIGALALGGALGAGLALGLLRLLLAILLREGGGEFFYASFFPGFLLGGALALGLVLANAAALRPQGGGSGPPASRPLPLAVLCGSLCFAAMHLLHTGLLNLSSLVGAPLVTPLAWVAGLGLSLAVYDQPMAGWRLGAGRWLLRLGLAAGTLALVQAVFVVTDLLLGPERDLGTGLVFAWSGYFYRSRLGSTLAAWGLGGITALPNWYHYAAIVDAALTGIALMLGLTAGLIWAGRQYQAWASLVRRAGD